MKKVNAVFQTDRGRVRSHNEDAGGVFHHGAGLCLAVVADGMGGHNAGETASRMTVDLMKEQWMQSGGAVQSPDDAQKWLEQAISASNEAVFAHARNHEAFRGMGTTLVAALCTDSFCQIAHIGDSRCYVQNEGGLSLLTNDHSLVNELVKSGEISKEDAAHHPKKNVLTRALGTDKDVAVDIRTVMFEEGDRLLLCTDGLSNKLSEQDIAQLLASDQPLAEKAALFISKANDNGGEDNITVALLEYDTSTKKVSSC